MHKALRVGLIGAGIQQSRSPRLHMEEARAQGLALTYDLIDLTAQGLSPSALPALLAEVEAAGFAGVNITHPCKQSVIPLLDDLSVDAAQLGAVNTVLFREGRRIGHNTDWSGFAESFRRGLPDVARDRVVLIGAGGAGAAVAHACLKLGVGRLWVHDAEGERADRLAQALNARALRDLALPVIEVGAVMREVDGVIHATPMGMDAHPGLPFDPDLLSARPWVAEIVYFPLDTAFLRAARARGCRTLDGGGMAVFQAVDAFRLFTGKEPDADRMIAHFARMTGEAVLAKG